VAIDENGCRTVDVVEEAFLVVQTDLVLDLGATQVALEKREQALSASAPDGRGLPAAATAGAGARRPSRTIHPMNTGGMRASMTKTMIRTARKTTASAWASIKRDRVDKTVVAPVVAAVNNSGGLPRERHRFVEPCLLEETT
jgi:hypothetical protein